MNFVPFLARKPPISRVAQGNTYPAIFFVPVPGNDRHFLKMVRAAAGFKRWSKFFHTTFQGTRANRPGDNLPLF
jgi:hypothetical protein